jgi:hypothetical protein
LEQAGLCTILVTMMPFWAERIGVPRTLAVEFPFGQTLGRAHDTAQQMRVLHQCLDVLAHADTPGEIVHSQESWPQPVAEAQKVWQPSEPSPIIAALAPRIREIMRERRRNQQV